MSFKPADFLITVFEFFSVMLPGAALCYFLGTQYGELLFAPGRLFPAPSNVEKWVMFIFSSYLFGHILFAIGSVLDDLYDKLKRIQKKRDSKYDLNYLTARYLQHTLMDGLLEKVLAHEFTRRRFREKNYWKSFDRKVSDEIEKLEANKDMQGAETARNLLTAGLEDREKGLADRAEILNAYKFVKAVMLLHFPAASAELTYMEASQKFFRTLFVTFSAVAILLFLHFVIPFSFNDDFLKPDFLIASLVCLLLAWVCFHRYGDQRFKSTALAYNLLISYCQTLPLTKKTE